MLKVGLTGNIGSGKSTVAKVFVDIGIPVYEADRSAKEFLLDNGVKDIIVKNFGEDILDNSNEINRKALASIVFNDKTKLNLLNSIIHPYVISDFEKWSIQYEDLPYVIFEAAILFETGYDRIVDKTITVTCPEAIRIKRIISRDEAIEEDVRQRIRNQWSEQAKAAKSNFIIINDEENLITPQVLAIHSELLK
jgi:dephospho-CoA kinase